MKEKKTDKAEFEFKPFDSYKWNSVSEKKINEVLDKDQINILKENKHYSTAVGTFKMN
jgi:hypothetical protein|tara:strand:- start:9183 stop:9356 length:174 start_codon:yes stop_codon:yes gene_type:complete